MLRVQPFVPENRFPLRQLVNQHLGAVLPGWALSEAALFQHLQRDYGEYVVDPWVDDRATLCVIEGHRVLAAVHLLRYGARPEIADWCRGTGTIAWVLALPDRLDAAAAVLTAAHERFAAWGVRQRHGWDTGLPAGPLTGVPDTWAHIATALQTAGYRPDPSVHREALYGGWLAAIPAPGEPPLAGLTLRRAVGGNGTRLAALLGDNEIGACEFTTSDPSDASVGWAELWGLNMAEPWRNQGVGSWLVRHAVVWLRLAGCDRVVLAVTEEDETAGAGRFYRRFGWDVFARETIGWTREPEVAGTPTK